MEKITITIFTMDLEYGNALGKAISNLHKYCLVTVKKLAESEENKQGDFVLLHGNGKSHRVYLSEEPVPHEEDFTVAQVYKYKKVSEILKDFLYTFAMNTGASWLYLESQKAELIGFYSATGGVGKTAISIGTARQLSKYEGMKLLYLSLEEMESTETYFHHTCQSTERNMGTYIYHLFHSEKKNMASFVESFMNSDDYGVEFFNPCKHRNEMKTLNCEELSQLLREILKWKAYDYIFLDLQNDLAEETQYLLRSCERIVIVEEDTLFSKMKTEKLLKYFQGTEGESDVTKFIRVKNKVEETTVAQTIEGILDPAEENEEKKIIIYRDDSSFLKQENGISISVENVFGLGVQDVVSEIRRGREEKL